MRYPECVEAVFDAMVRAGTTSQKDDQVAVALGLGEENGDGFVSAIAMTPREVRAAVDDALSDLHGLGLVRRVVPIQSAPYIVTPEGQRAAIAGLCRAVRDFMVESDGSNRSRDMHFLDSLVQRTDDAPQPDPECFLRPQFLAADVYRLWGKDYDAGEAAGITLALAGRRVLRRFPSALPSFPGGDIAVQALYAGFVWVTAGERSLRG